MKKNLKPDLVFLFTQFLNKKKMNSLETIKFTEKN